MSRFTAVLLAVVAGASSFNTRTDGDAWYEGLDQVMDSALVQRDGPEQRLVFRDDLVVDFMLFTRATRRDPEVLRIDNIPAGRFDSSSELKIIVHGWRNGYDSPLGDILKEAYLDSYDINVIVVDWSSKSYKNYLGSRMAVPKVADELASMVDRLVKRHGLNPSRLHMIGHSLGAHVAGIAGLRLPYKIARITGLDPAAPMFTMAEEDIIKPESATFVDVIHTCGYMLGLISPLGHADFYPNKGTPAQPGCGFDYKGECSHSRAYELYAETIGSRDLLAVKCDDSTAFDKDKCSLPTIPMGEHAPSSARGLFFLKTGGATPFALGDQFLWG